jgi:hypothetical protein
LLSGKLVTSLTTDNGIENKAHAAVTAATRAVVYFTDPYSSWQKGGVENANKMLRRYFPKGTDSRWKMYPNAGADLDFSPARNVAISLRPDWTVTNETSMFSGLVTLGVTL